MECFCCGNIMKFELIEVNEFRCAYSYTCFHCNKKIYLSAIVDEYSYFKNGVFVNQTSSYEKTKNIYMEN